MPTESSGPNKFAKARFYDPATARFTTQDSELGKVDEPPSLHRYFYGNDNPLRYIDPTGHTAQQANPERHSDGVEKTDLQKMQAEDDAAAERMRFGKPVNAPTPAVAPETDTGWFARHFVNPFKKAIQWGGQTGLGQGLGHIFDQAEALAKGAGVAARVETQAAAPKQSEAALREKQERHRLFEGQSGSPTGDEFARRHIEVNPGQQFVDNVKDINQEFAEQGTRQAIPLAAGVVAGKVLRAGGQVAEGVAADLKVARTVPGSQGYRGYASEALKKAMGANPFNTRAEAHHIFDVAEHASPLGQKLQKFGIDLNAAENGVWLPRYAPEDYAGAVHRGRSTDAYKQIVARRLGVAQTREEALAALDSLRSDLQNGALKINEAARTK